MGSVTRPDDYWSPSIIWYDEKHCQHVGLGIHSNVRDEVSPMLQSCDAARLLYEMPLLVSLTPFDSARNSSRSAKMGLLLRLPAWLMDVTSGKSCVRGMRCGEH